MRRTVFARLTKRTAFWGSDAGGRVYDFGHKDMTANETVEGVTFAGQRRAASYRMFDDGLALELEDSATYPESIRITLREFR